MAKHAAFKLCAMICTVLFLFSLQIPLANSESLEESVPITLTSNSCMLIDNESGAVIFEKNGDMKCPAASITKLMTALLVLEKLEAEEINLNDGVIVSETAAAATGSQVLLDANNEYKLETLLKSTIMASGNDSAVALAEHLAGTEEAFVDLMNERAKELGMFDTNYQNCTGLPANNQYTTAKDISKLAREIIKHPEYMTYASVWMDELVHPSGRVTSLTNTNRLVRFYKDCDGLKTGSTNEAKYCVAATAKRNNMRLIAIVLGSQGSQIRFDEARNMLDYGFAHYKIAKIAKENDGIEEFVPVRFGAIDQVEAAFGKDVSIFIKNGQEKEIVIEALLEEELVAPIEQGEIIGQINILLNNKIVASIPAISKNAVRLPGFLEGCMRVLENWK